MLLLVMPAKAVSRAADTVLGPLDPAFAGVTEDEAAGVICLVRTTSMSSAPLLVPDVGKALEFLRDEAGYSHHPGPSRICSRSGRAFATTPQSPLSTISAACRGHWSHRATCAGAPGERSP